MKLVRYKPSFEFNRTFYYDYGSYQSSEDEIYFLRIEDVRLYIAEITYYEVIDYVN